MRIFKRSALKKIGLAGALFFFFSCESLFISPDPANKPLENFDMLWKSVDEKYSYFELKEIDWNEVRNTYRPQIRQDMNDQELFNIMGEMLYLLRDGHVNLTSSFNVARNWEWYLNYPPNFNSNILERNYLGKNYQIAGPFRTKVFGKIGYIRYGDFLGDFDESTLDGLLSKYMQLSGLIIDVRNNTGGFTHLVDRMVARFVTEKTLVGFGRYKEGPGHNEFSKPIPRYIEPAGTRFNKPVVILTNRSVYSAANMFVSYMSHLPNVTIIGDQTGGGGGLPYSGELMNGWQYRFSTSQLFTAEMEHVEHGIPPHVQVDMLPEEEAMGIDTILEYALRSFD